MVLKILLVLVFKLLQFSVANKTEPAISNIDLKYCALKCGTVNHTMCSTIVPPHGPPMECSGFIGGFTLEEKELLLDTHNELRRQVAVGETQNQPLAANMLKLVWDDEAAMIAQRWADQCTDVEHDVCRNSLSGEEMGQNLKLFTANSRKDAITTVLAEWFGQLVNFNNSLVSKYDKSDDSAGCYTQIAWAKTNRVGCGLAAQEKHLDKQYKIVCNYIPAGLVKGEEVYTEGIPCTKCPAGYHCSIQKPGLCTTNQSDYLSSQAATFITSYPIILMCLGSNLISLCC